MGQMSVVEFENIGADCVEKRSGKHIRPFATADDGRLRLAEKGFSARTASSIASSRQPASAAPTKFKVVRLASSRTSSGTSCNCESARNSAKRRITFAPRSSSQHEITAIDRDRAPGHPERLVGREKEDRTDDVLGLTKAA
jgi:hypothetical protein